MKYKFNRIASWFRRFRKDERGAIGVTFVLGSTVLITMAGFAIDFGLVISTQGQMRNTADAAALAAVTSLSNSATATTLATNIAASNMPPAQHGTVLASGDVELGTWDSASKTFTAGATPANAARAIVRKTAATNNPVNLFFARIINRNTVDLTVQAVATAPAIGTACVLALAPSASAAIDVSGNADVVFDGCDLAANSTDNDALDVSNGTLTTANCASVVGGSSAGPPQLNLNCGAVRQNSRPIADPYAGIPAPVSAGCPPGTNNFQLNNGTANLTPGTFCGKFRVQGGTVNLAPGTYILDQADFTVNAGATITGTGVTFILTDSSGGDNPGQVTINGGAIVDLVAPTSGDYSGIVFYQDKATLDLGGTANKFNGGSTTNFTGAIYFPNEKVQFNGGNSLGTGSECTQIIAATVDFSGNSTVKSNCTGIGTTDIDVPGGLILVL